MQNDPLVEWQRLSEVYRGMYDDELLNLAADAKDLTETAQQVLDAEMKKRGLTLLRASDGWPPMREPMQERRATLRTDRGALPRPVPDPESTEDAFREQHEYTWKIMLCECQTTDQAQQLSEVLSRAGIENWIEQPGSEFRYSGFDLSYPRVVVAADQLEQARQIAAQPVPKDIVAESKIEVPEFQSPACPKCGSADPALEGVDPFNTWKCESCGNQWAESAQDSTPSAGSDPP